jgi:hypothetical protein
MVLNGKCRGFSLSALKAARSRIAPGSDVSGARHEPHVHNLGMHEEANTASHVASHNSPDIEDETQCEMPSYSFHDYAIPDLKGNVAKPNHAGGIIAWRGFCTEWYSQRCTPYPSGIDARPRHHWSFHQPTITISPLSPLLHTLSTLYSPTSVGSASSDYPATRSARSSAGSSGSAR